jgi:hypothetical protein
MQMLFVGCKAFLQTVYRKMSHKREISICQIIQKMEGRILKGYTKATLTSTRISQMKNVQTFIVTISSIMTNGGLG